MNIKSIESLLTRSTLAVGAFAILLAFVEGFVQLLGHSLMARNYAPSRILEIGAVLLILSIALMVKQIRDEARSSRT